MDHKITGVSYRKKLKLDNLTFPLPVEENEWFWDPVNDSGLTPFLKTVRKHLSRTRLCLVRDDGIRRPAASICMLGR